MNFAEMKVLLEFYVDDAVDTPIALRLINEGKNQMAAAVNASFPDITETSPGDVFVFDTRFHELPVLYAAAMVKAYDSSIREKESFMFDFQTRLKDFVKNFVPMIEYEDSDNVQHFTAAANQMEFTVTKPSYTSYGDLDVYVNSTPVPYRRYGNVITLETPLTGGERVTIQWDLTGYNDVPSYMRVW